MRLAVSFLAQAVVLGVLGTWYVGTYAGDLRQADMIATIRLDTANARTAELEAQTDRIEGKVLNEIKSMRAELNQRMDRIEDRMERDRRRTP